MYDMKVIDDANRYHMNHGLHWRKMLQTLLIFCLIYLLEYLAFYDSFFSDYFVNRDVMTFNREVCDLQLVRQPDPLGCSAGHVKESHRKNQIPNLVCSR